MKALVQPVEILRALAEFVAGPLDVAAHLMQRADDAGFPGIVAASDRKPDRLDLDRGAHQGDVEQVFAADIGDAKAALSGADDQPARHQPRQAFTQRCRADVIALHQIDDTKPGSRREQAGENVLLDQRCRAFAQRRGFGHWSTRREFLSRHCETLISGQAYWVRVWIAAFSGTTSPRSTIRAARV